MEHLTTIQDIERTLLMEGKEIYRASQFINLEELEQTINKYQEL